ncbi:MAG: AtpZ/AtpI family protein [Candidatus Izemoplasmatales bacterium]|jgi:F0F1-type ATP synthase assembly protein I|nr:AtpZ/AtpI family protein [Candidatus Izemoplasmatales bacterium]MDD4070484.1 AtpZ/AtpI family protein [Candidatus Izemoplasmatales bacterium]MDY0139052.1 AtpZ/AtpI family protein [Candidatus Izemoplasmatales bacterium]
MRNKGKKSVYYVFNLVVQFFVETFVAMVIGYFLGKYLDSLWFPEKEVLVYVLLILGIFAGLSNFIKRAISLSNKGENDEKDQSN